MFAVGYSVSRGYTVVDTLCRNGVTINATDGTLCALWQALDQCQEYITDILVGFILMDD
jgi:hypothetical protein